jgi:hypothetical protein
MRRAAGILAVAACLAALGPAVLSPGPARADFGFGDIDIRFLDSEGAASMQAGSHPFEMRTSFTVNTFEKEGREFVDGALRNLDVFLSPGFTGNPTAVPRCSTLDFLNQEFEIEGISYPNCADSSAVGYINNVLGRDGLPVELSPFAVYNLEPSPGVAAKFGFWAGDVPVTVELGVNPEFPYNVQAKLRDTAQTVEVFASELIVWGNPADPVHDPVRGHCVDQEGASCPAGVQVEPFLTLPRSCTGPLGTLFRATSWWSGHDPADPGPPAFFEGEGETHDEFGAPLGTTECGKLDFGPRLSVQPTTDRAESPSGLVVTLDVEDEGLTDPKGIAQSDIQKAVVALPEGMTANPSLAEGLAACSPADLERETVKSLPGEGCPQASKVGTVEVETPVLEEEILEGQLFIATQDDPATTEPGAENPFDSLLALYMVIKDPKLGIILKLPGKIEPDPSTGQLVTSFDDIPQQPVSHIRLRLREGGRSPLISPPTCGTHTTEAEFTPSANPAKSLELTTSFLITQGVGGGPCPPSGPPPFAPGFNAGSTDNHAAVHSPFSMRLTRRDGDQDLTRFDVDLPPGLVAKLAGVSRCPDAAIAVAKAKRGRQEQASPSCPSNSEIGRVLGGAGVGSQLTYVPGKLYLAGPFGGGPLSVVGIVPAVAGPFDVGNVVVRQALRINPRTAEVRVDGANSDPIPHILAGIPLRVRDIHVHVDRHQFTLNPTSCKRFEVAAQVWGGGANPFSVLDDAPVPRTTPFQAADCASLGFRPRLSLRLEGGTKRGDHPALRGVYRPQRGDANLAALVLRLPRSAFLDQAHIRTICTRVQFAADACPKGAVYGFARAFTPLLEDPLEGPVYLRSSNHNLPDLVFDLHGLVDFEAVFRIDSKNGGIRATFAGAPDAPLAKAIVQMQGGKKGLIVNSRNLCATPARADLDLRAQNDKRRHLHPPVRPGGCEPKR